jgi:uncharacterized repeat protein (TIGR01451 family)
MRQKRILFLMISLGLLVVALSLIAWVMPLVDYADATFDGTNSYDRAGESVAIIGDVNGDGYDDFLIGARAGDVIAINGGGVYLFLGEPGASWGSDLPVDMADATFGSAGYQDYAGHDVAGAGDVNGDGFDDFLIGADGYDAPGVLTQTGRVHLYLGRQAADWGQGVDVANSDASFVGEVAYANTGLSVAGAGDINGDGYDDFLFSAHPEGTATIYLYLGKASPDWGNDASLSTADASFVVSDNSGGSDVSVTGVGDVNDDGYDDFLVGSYSTYAYLILGKASADWGQDFDLANADAILELEATDVKVTGAGDVNHDGLDDMLVASQYINAGEINRGKAYLILGREAADWGSDFDLANSADASYIGAYDRDKVGCAVSGAGDANRDGYDDFLIGACFSDATDTLLDTGAAYLVLGRPDGWELNVVLADADTAIDLAALPGEATEDQAGIGLAGGGDVNGDGFDDVLVGALEHDCNGKSDVGKVYLMLGKGLALKKTVDTQVVEPGGQITYTLSYTNTNSWPVETVRIADDIPAHTSFVGCTGGVSCSLVNQTVWWNLGTIPADSTGSAGLVLQVLPDAPGGTFIFNTAAITAPSHLNPVYSLAIVRVSGGFELFLPLVVRDSP